MVQTGSGTEAKHLETINKQFKLYYYAQLKADVCCTFNKNNSKTIAGRKHKQQNQQKRKQKKSTKT